MLGITGLVAATLLGADAPKAPQPPLISYQLRHLEMNGLDWRASMTPQLTFVAQQGPATVWTAPKGAAAGLQAKAARVLDAPRLASHNRATFIHQTGRSLLTGLNRLALAPADTVARVAYTPQVENVSEGWAASVEGRKIDQGVLARVTLDDKQVTAVHEVTLSGPKANDRGEVCQAMMKVPEVARAEVSGEWLIPNDGVLLVSFGPRTSADPSGKAVVRERLTVIEPRQAEGPGSPFQAGPLPVSPPTLGQGPMPAPATPSRALPVMVQAPGGPVPLPPLPADPTPPTALPNSAEPCATPQTRKEPVGDPVPPKRDTAAKATSYSPETPRPSSGWTPAPSRMFTFRVPLHGSLVSGELSLNVEARVTPSPSADVPAPPEVRPSKP